jgi:uncharacterized repeat protein (TIGR03803 family)
MVRRVLFVSFIGLVVNGSEASAQLTPSVVTGFGGSVAVNPYIGSGLIKGSDGAFYGVTYDSSNTRCGTVYRLLADGTLTVLHEFQGHFAQTPDGCHPQGQLVEAADGNLYGTTTDGGGNADATFPSGTGSIFKLSKAGDAVAYSLVRSFAAYNATLTYWPEGVRPIGGLTIGLDGNFYGTTSFSGAGSVSGGNCTSLGGTVFRLTLPNTLTVIHAFSFSEGCAPTNLVLAADGSFLGTTIQGGDAGGDQSLGGTVFRVTSAGAFTKLYVFPGTINSGTPYGAGPYGAPVEASDGSLYGTTTGGGPASGGNEAGTVYKLSLVGSTWQPTLVHAFTGANGAYPFASLTTGADGNFYGTTSGGGDFGNGTIFRITQAGSHAKLYSFAGPSDGSAPVARMLEASPGSFYGTTSAGGASSRGVIFTFSIGMATTITLGVSTATAVFGQPVTLSATVTSTSGNPSGQVEFLDGTTSLGTAALVNGAAQLATSGLSVGTHSLLARYPGGGGFLPSDSTRMSVTVNRAATTTTLGSAPNPTTRKQAVTVTATVAPVSPGAGTATGQVQFFEGKRKLGTATLVNGTATLQISFNSMGQQVLTATYAGDANFAGSTSASFTHTVNR